mgnify:CR=1 FL=1
MSNFVKSNVGNILIVNEEIAEMVKAIDFHENIASKIDDEVIVHLASVLFIYEMRNGKENRDKLAKKIVRFALMKSEFNDLFNIEDVDAEESKIDFTISTHDHTTYMSNNLIRTFVSNAKIRKQLLWLISDESKAYKK